MNISADMTGFNMIKEDKHSMSASTSRAITIRLDLIIKASFVVVHFLCLGIYMYRHQQVARMSLKVSEKYQEIHRFSHKSAFIHQLIM